MKQDAIFELEASRQCAATFSPCRKYRYELWRYWPMPARKGFVLFVCLNPSTADETQDDPTIRRCISYARSWGYEALCMVNLFAFRSTDPAGLLSAADPIGPDNDRFIRRNALDAGLVVAAWGTHGTLHSRDRSVREILVNAHALRLTKDGHPSHPLYLPKTLTPLPLTDMERARCQA